MAVKVYKPTTPARRHTSVLLSDDITSKKPLKSLLARGKNHAGRNNTGKITVRHRSGKGRRQIRVIDYRRDKFDVPAKVATIEYDPNRNARIALLNYVDGEKRYMIAPQSLEVGATVVSSKKLVELTIGNHLPLGIIPPGMFVYNVELVPGKGGQLARSAGNSVYLMGVDNGFAQLKLPSGEVRLVADGCMATIGAVSNPDFKNIRWGKAGRMRHRGIRPTVRGKVMNPCDHPHGGGEAANSIGMKHPKTPWGKPALGVKTRRKGKKSDKMILQRRKIKRKK
jgi:large subunit ribosomal protein L2